MDPKNVSTYELKGQWNAADKGAIEMLFNEHGIQKDKNLIDPPDVKYWGKFRELSNYIVDGEFEGQGYYKGEILDNGEIKIAGLEFIKQV